MVVLGSGLVLNSTFTATEWLGGWFQGVFPVPSRVWRCFVGLFVSGLVLSRTFTAAEWFSGWFGGCFGVLIRKSFMFDRCSAKEIG